MWSTEWMLGPKISLQDIAQSISLPWFVCLLSQCNLMLSLALLRDAHALERPHYVKRHDSLDKDLFCCSVVQFCSHGHCGHFWKCTVVSLGALDWSVATQLYMLQCTVCSDTFITPPAWLFYLFFLLWDQTSLLFPPLLHLWALGSWPHHQFISSSFLNQINHMLAESHKCMLSAASFRE